MRRIGVVLAFLFSVLGAHCAWATEVWLDVDVAAASTRPADDFPAVHQRHPGYVHWPRHHLDLPRQRLKGLRRSGQDFLPFLQGQRQFRPHTCQSFRCSCKQVLVNPPLQGIDFLVDR